MLQTVEGDSVVECVAADERVARELEPEDYMNMMGQLRQAFRGVVSGPPKRS